VGLKKTWVRCQAFATARVAEPKKNNIAPVLSRSERKMLKEEMGKGARVGPKQKGGLGPRGIVKVDPILEPGGGEFHVHLGSER